LATHAGHHTAMRVSDGARSAPVDVSAPGGRRHTLTFLREGASGVDELAPLLVASLPDADPDRRGS
jgi:hypothetical protein